MTTTTYRTSAGTDSPWRVHRLNRTAKVALVAAAVLVVALVFLPYGSGQNIQNTLTSIFLLVVMASLWNLLAGYAGLVSFGQQAYIGVGAYSLLVLVRSGINAYAAVPIAALICLVVSIPLSYGLFRTRGAYFAIATWVVAEAFRLLIITVPALGGGEGATLPFTGFDPIVRTALTYWTALVLMIASIGACWWFLRSRTGLDAAAVRDDEHAAFSLGVRTDWARRVPYLISAAGFGAVGAVILLSNLRVEPASIFSVNYSANAFFMALIGGVGTLEGPIVGAIIFYGLQYFLSDLGALYLVLLGLVAILVMLVIPKGVWGSLSHRFGVVLFPVGYRLRPADGAAPPARSEATALDAGEAGATPAILHEAAEPSDQPEPGSAPRTPGSTDPRGDPT
jgi:branched-chain amino acid transport system permease protein